MLPRVFSYWDGPIDHKLQAFVEEWSSSMPKFSIFGNSDVIEILEKYFPYFVDDYILINIPAAKSDVARLLLLYELGGLYVDCHFGLKKNEDIVEFLAFAEKQKGLFVDLYKNRGERKRCKYWIINGNAAEPLICAST